VKEQRDKATRCQAELEQVETEHKASVDRSAAVAARHQAEMEGQRSQLSAWENQAENHRALVKLHKADADTYKAEASRLQFQLHALEDDRDEQQEEQQKGFRAVSSQLSHVLSLIGGGGLLNFDPASIAHRSLAPGNIRVTVLPAAGLVRATADKTGEAISCLNGHRLGD
jgi:hypothetical protein